MQVLGMLPRKERPKKKEKEIGLVVNEITLAPLPLEPQQHIFEPRKKMKFQNVNRRLSKLNSDIINRDSSGMDDPEDPYAFPDPTNDTGSKNAGTSPYTTPSTPQPETYLAIPAVNSNSSGGKSPGGGSDSGTASVTSIAKLYPELAEKLEKIKPKYTEINKAKEKGKERSSRTMNILQSKIAQNRIKDKMKRNQESSSQSQSPSYFNNMNNLSHAVSPMNNVDMMLDFGNKTPVNDLDNLVLQAFDSPSSLGNHLGFNHQTQGLNNVHELKRLQQIQLFGLTHEDSPVHTDIHNVMRTGVQGFNLGAIPPPPSLPEGIPHGVLPENLPGMPRADQLPPHFGSNTLQQSLSSARKDGVHTQDHPFRNNNAADMINSAYQSPSSLPLIKLTPAQSIQKNVIPSSPSLPVPTAVSMQSMQHFNHQPPPNQNTFVSPITVSHPPPSYHEATGSDKTMPPVAQNIKDSITSTVMSQTGPIATATKECLLPPPPYTAPHKISKQAKSSKSRRSKQAAKVVDVSKFMLPSDLIKPRKLRKIYEQTETVCKKLDNEAAEEHYIAHVNRKRLNHHYVNGGMFRNS